jgi:competence protein ComEC
MPETTSARERLSLLLPALAGAVLGPTLQLQQATLWPGWVYGCFGALALVIAAYVAIKSIANGASFWVFLGCAAAVSLAGAGLRAGGYAAGALHPALEGRDLVLTGVVAAMPQRNDAGLRFRLDVESASDGAGQVVVPARVLLGWYGGVGAGELQRQPVDLRAGERWQLQVRLKAPHGNLNPHGFDYELWLWEQGLQATGYVRSGPKDRAPQRLGATWQYPLEAARQQVRDAILQRIADRRMAGVVAALVTGDQAAIDRADWDVYRATGVAHLMSISGLHVTMFAWAAAALVGGLWRRSARLCLAWPAPHAAIVGGLGLATAYALFSGWGVPAQRTVLMLAAVGLLRLTGRDWPWPMVWLLACAVVVTVDPWALMQAGFWLSFVAVGVLFAADPAAPPGAGATLVHRLRALLREQAVVSVALAPLGLLLFGQVSVVGLLANLLAIPWVTLLVTPMALLGVLVPWAWDGAALAVQAMAGVLGWLAAWPGATVSTAMPPLWAAAVGMLGAVLLVFRLPWRVRALGLPLLMPALFWQPLRPPAGEFELLAADIGQGNAVLVRTARHTLVYDAGPRYSRETDAGHRVLVPLLRALDEQVHTLVLSHRDSDHTGGAPAVLQMQPQAQLLSSVEADHELQALRPARRCAAGQGWTWDGVRFEVLHPVEADYDQARKPNALSCVLRVSTATRSALLAGDIEQPQEAALLQRATATGQSLKSDVLLVPHHGSKTSSSPAFLDAVAPTLAMAQAGYRNRFGHPAPEVLARYAQRDIRVADSARCGAANWRSDQPDELRCEREAARRYWHHRLP